MRYFRLAYKDNMTSTTHVEDVRAVSAEEAASISPMNGMGYPLSQVKEISLAERAEAIKSHIGMADFDRKMMVRCGVMSEERARHNYENVVRHYEVELKEVEEAMAV